MHLKFFLSTEFFQFLQRVFFCHFFFANFFAFIPLINCSSQCNIGLKLFSVESGNAICAPITPHQCIESCEWVEADRGGCPLSTHYTAFRGRRTILTGMVLTESSFLIQCCASLATSVLLDADHEPICRWSEQIETVIDKPTVRLDNPLGEQEYYRDLRGTRIGRGAAKIQTEICRFIVQRTNCDRKRMTQEDFHQYSLLLLRLQRTRDFFRHSRGGVINTGFSETLTDGERARAEHRTIYKNSTSKLTDELEFLHKGRDDPDANILKAAVAALEDSPEPKNISPSLVENEIVQEKKREKEKVESEDGIQPPRMLVDGMSNNNGNENNKEGKSTPKSPAERVIYNDRKRRIQHEGRQKGPQHSSRKSSSFSAQIVEPTIPPSRPILADESREEGKNTSNNSNYKNAAAAARGVRELLYRAAKQGSALLLEKLNQQQRQWQKEGGGGKKSNFNASIGPRASNSPNHHQKYQKMLLPVIRRLRTFPHRHRPSRHQKEGEGGPVRMEMSRLGWPKGLRRRLWPVLATNTTRELIPTRTDLNWVDNEFFDGVFPGKIRNGVTGTVRVVDPSNPSGGGSNSQSSSSMLERRIRLDRLRPPEQPSSSAAAENISVGRDLRIKKLHKNLISNGRSDEAPPIGGNNELLEDPIESSSREEGPKEKLISLDGNGLDGGGFLALPSSGGGSFEPEIPPRQQQILPFHAIKEINTSPLGRAPPFRVVPFGNSHQKLVQGRREGQVPSKGENGQLAKLLECCQQQAPGCRALCTRDVSKEQIKLAMSTGQCPPLSLTSVIQCFPRFYNISSVGQCCARMSQTNSAAPNLFSQPAKKLPAQCLNLCAPDFRLSFAHLACVDHTEPIMACYRQLLERVEGSINENGVLEDLVADGQQQNLRQRRKKE